MNFIRDLLEKDKIMIFLNICKKLFELYRQNMNKLTIFEPVIFYLFILERTLHPFIYYDDDELPSFLLKYPSNFWTNLGLSTYCEIFLRHLNNPLIIILKYLFFQGKKNTLIKTEEIELLIKIFSDEREEFLIDELIRS
jgi:hypothetical protein